MLLDKRVKSIVNVELLHAQTNAALPLSALAHENDSCVPISHQLRSKPVADLVVGLGELPSRKKGRKKKGMKRKKKINLLNPFLDLPLSFSFVVY